MTRQEIFNKVKTLILDELQVDEAKVTEEATFESDLGADSLDAIELITGIEDEFGVSIPDEEAMQLRTVGAIVDFLEKNL